ncbi:hypothetical protein [Rhodococcus sp. ACS1]|uniref:hypothetical protein n=1 Tax=Rhodococcus sp. ACS1 TaxID=2028570 RepID=UPI00117AEE3F|nr:hypothetical protein [Rhodococcus sp. ACS1]
MTTYRDLTPLAKIVFHHLYQVKQSWSYEDTAQQVADEIQTMMPTETALLLEREKLVTRAQIAEMEKQSAILQHQAHMARVHGVRPETPGRMS